MKPAPLVSFFEAKASSRAVRDFDLDRFEEHILEAWEEYPGEKLHDLFDMKSRVLECILTSDPPGGNSFKLPHRSANEK